MLIDHLAHSLQIKLSATQGATLTLEQIVKIQEQHVQQNVQLSHLALHVQCLQAENEKLQETTQSLDSAHKVWYLKITDYLLSLYLDFLNGYLLDKF